MKTFKILAILIIVLGIIYFQLDKRLFYYGRNDLHIYHLLPFSIEPDYQPPFEGGFALRDENGFSIAGKGVAYRVNNRTIWINTVLKYGFNTQHFVAVVNDSNKTKYYVKFNQNQKDKSVNATMEGDNKFNNLKLDKWINIEGNEDYIWRLYLYRNYSMLLVITLFLTLIYKLVRYRKAMQGATVR